MSGGTDAVQGRRDAARRRDGRRMNRRRQQMVNGNLLGDGSLRVASTSCLQRYATSIRRIAMLLLGVCVNKGYLKPHGTHTLCDDEGIDNV